MPETSVYEYGDLTLRKNQIRFASNFGQGTAVQPIAKPLSV
jgi:hypothetical protein